MDFFAPLADRTLEFVRNDIILQKDSYYFDWTASGLESRAILRRMESILPKYANTHSSSSLHAQFMMDLYHEAREKLKEHLNLDENFTIIPSGFGATGAMKRFQEIWGLYIPPKTRARLANPNFNANLGANLGSNLYANSGANLNPSNIATDAPLVLIGPFEHHSNEISLREALCESIRIPLNGVNIDMRALQTTLEKNKNRELFASMNIASNVSGIVLPYDEISRMLRDFGANIAFDLAAISPHENISCALFDNAFLSPHKLLGGIGSCGILCIRNSAFDAKLAPTFSGGGVIKYASGDIHFYVDDFEAREDYGTPAILGLLKAALAYQYRNEIGLDFIKKREKVLRELLLSELREIRDIEIYGDNLDNKGAHIPTVSFNIASISPYDLSYELSNNYGIETRAGCSCAGSYGHDLMHKPSIQNLEALEQNPLLKPAWLRVSLHYSHNLRDIEYFMHALKKTIARLS